VASVVPRRAYHHTRILRALNKLLDDPRRSYTCNQVAVELAREEGAATAAWLIEQALRQTEGARQRRQGAMCTDALLPPPLLP
jgi:hypothetical protein